VTRIRTVDSVMREINGTRAPLGRVVKRQRYQQQQRRIYERRGVFIPVDDLESADMRDHLEVRAMWRRWGRALTIDSSYDRLRGIIRVRLAP
jgi:hypothetical protein